MKPLKYTAMLLALVSCTDLDEEIFSQITTENYYNTSENIVSALTGTYAHAFYTGWADYGNFIQEIVSDQLIVPTRGRHGFGGGLYVRFYEHKWTDQEMFITSLWNGPFQGVAFCNKLLADFRSLDFAAFGLTEATRSQYIAELRALRAWYYMFLIDGFRHVPIVTNVNDVRPQSTPQEVFDFIETDLTEALPALPRNAKYSRMDQATAAAILVRLYLNAEKYIGRPHFEECARVAREIIDGKYGSYSIDPSYTGPFRCGVNGYRSPENIFQFNQQRNYAQSYFIYEIWQHYASRYSFGVDHQGGNGGSLSPSRDPDGNLYDFKLGMTFEKYPDGDRRKQPFRVTSPSGDYEGFFLMGPQYYFDSERGYGFTDQPVVGSEEYNGRPLIFVDQVGRFSEGAEGLAKGSHLIYGEENTGYRIMKFPWLPGDLFFDNAIPEVRLAEIYYSLAECKYRAGDRAGAAKLLDAVRKRYYTDEQWPSLSYEQNPQKLTDDEFVDEWGREFLAERRRRTDLVRWGLFSTASWWEKQPDATNMDVFPIPYSALNANPLLVQTTPGF